MCRSKEQGGRRCTGQCGTPAVEAMNDLLAAAARPENEGAPRYRSFNFYKYRSAARQAWRETIRSTKSDMNARGIDPYADVDATEARRALGGAIRQVEGMGWVSPVERATAVRRLSRASRNARRSPLSRVVLTALLRVVSQLVLGRDNAARVYALAGMVQSARLELERREQAKADEQARLQSEQEEYDRQLISETFESFEIMPIV